MFDTNSIKNVARGASIESSTTNLQRSYVNLRTSVRRIRDDFLRLRHQELLRRPYNWRNTLVNPLDHCQENNREGPATQ